MNDLFPYWVLGLMIFSIFAIYLLIKKTYFLNNEKQVINKIIKKDILKQKIQQTEGSIALKNFKILDLWQSQVVGKESFIKMEVFIENEGKFYEYEAIWNSKVFEKNKKIGFNDSPIVISIVRQSDCVSLNEWEDTKYLGV